MKQKIKKYENGGPVDGVKKPVVITKKDKKTISNSPITTNINKSESRVPLLLPSGAPNIYVKPEAPGTGKMGLGSFRNNIPSSDKPKINSRQKVSTGKPSFTMNKTRKRTGGATGNSKTCTGTKCILD